MWKQSVKSNPRQGPFAIKSVVETRGEAGMASGDLTVVHISVNSLTWMLVF